MDSQDLLSKVSALVESQDTVNISPEVHAALYGMAYHFYRNGKYEESRRFFRFLTLFDALDRRCWMGLAASYHMLKDYSAAIECYSVAAVQNPNDPYAHWHAAECFFSIGKTKEALEALDSALTVSKKSDSHLPLVSQLELVQQAWHDKLQGEAL